MKKTAMILAVVILSLSVLAVATGCNPTEAQAESYVVVDINPSVEFVLDSDNKVLSVKAVNEDAQVMLYGEKGIIGLSVEDASRRIAELAVEYKYVKEDATISVTVTGKNHNTEDSIYAHIEAGFLPVFDKTDLEVALTRTANIMYEKRLEMLKQRYPDNADIQAMDSAKLRLVDAAMLADFSLDLEEAAAMTNEQLAAVVSEAHEKYSTMIRAVAETVYDAAVATYENAVQTALDSAYITVSLVNGTRYSALRAAHRSILTIAEAAEKLAQLTGITDEQIEEIGRQLQLEGEKLTQFVEEVKNQGSQSVVESVNYVVDRMYANMTDSEKEAWDQYVENAQATLDLYRQEIEKIDSSVKSQLKAALALVEGFTGLDFSEINTFADFYNQVLDAMENKIAELEQWFEENLTAEEKQKVAELQGKMSDTIEKAEQTLNNAIEQLRQEAEEFFTAKQQERLSA